MHLYIKVSHVTLFPTLVWEFSDDDRRFDYTSPLFEDYLYIYCAYNYSDAMEESDLMDAYLDFHWSYYVSLMLTFFVFLLSWDICSKLGSKISQTIRTELDKARLPGYWTMICAVLDQDQFPAISRISFSILSFCFSLFFFITVDCFMMNTMSADLVTISDPVVVRSYQDVIDRADMKVLFFKGHDEEILFSSAQKASLDGKIWEKRYLLQGISVEAIGEVVAPIISQKMVILGRGWFGMAASNLGFSKAREYGLTNWRTLRTKDETGKSFTNGLLIHRNSPQELKDYMSER